MSLSEYEKNIIYKPRTGTEMENATLNRVPVLKYADLCAIAEKVGSPSRVLSHMFAKSSDNIILLQDPDNMNSGHWISVSCNKPKKEIYFFSTYGGKPDVEKEQWISEDELRMSGQLLNIFREGLQKAQEHGWEIHYNDYPYQKVGDKTATCGIFTAAFLRSGKNPDEFKKETLQIQRSGKNPAIVYYERYFL